LVVFIAVRILNICLILLGTKMQSHTGRVNREMSWYCSEKMPLNQKSLMRIDEIAE